MAKRPASFLSLPRELRHKIIFNTYDDGANKKQIGQYIGFTMVKLEFMVDEERFAERLAAKWGYIPYTTGLFPDMVRAIDAWSATLKDVHKDLEEDMEFVAQNLGSVEWISFVRFYAKY